MKFFFWTLERPPRLLEYPGLVLRLALFGALAGPLWTAFFIVLFARPIVPQFQPLSKFFLYSCYDGAVFCVCFYCSCRVPWFYLASGMRKYPTRLRWGIVAGVGSLGSMLGYTLSWVFLSLLPGNVMHLSHVSSVLALEAVIGAILALIIGTIKSRFQAGKLRESELAEAAARAQASALQAQINPHFFFNTLNTLSALIPINQDAALEVVGLLADMFRYTLACSQSQKVTLAQELTFVGNYLKLEQARFSPRLTVSMPMGDFNDIQLPGLSLQPLVENAIRHSIAKRIEGGAVEISVHRNGTSCSVDVFSPAEAPIASNFFREGHALANVRDRLRLYAGAAAGVDVAHDGRDRVRVSLVLPLVASV